MKLKLLGFGKPLLLAGCICATFMLTGFQQPAVQVDPDSGGPRNLEAQTRAAVVRDYLQAWKSLSGALQENRADLLDPSFVGIAKEKLTDAVREQQALGMKTHYRDLSHDLKIVFYSPEGLSIQLLDTVQYEIQVIDHDRVQATQHLSTRYVAVLTPTEVRWKVRVFQAQPDSVTGQRSGP
jgi:hypothetical protein